jgi:glyoxylase-like metal-dependent hydrolase (beta-lactamase superfamily II)
MDFKHGLDFYSILKNRLLFYRLIDMTKNTYKPLVRGIFDPSTCSVTYVVYQYEGGACAIIDSVLDYDPKSGRTSHASADLVVNFVRERKLQVKWILETHAHADHLTAAAYLKEELGGQIGIGAHITSVQQVFQKVFNLEPEFKTDGSQFDVLLKPGQSIALDDMVGNILDVPGHTPACVAYQFGDAVFVGDTLFMPDVGTARCDFPGGDAKTLYTSVQKLLSLPADTRLFMCHDYPPTDRPIAFESSVAEQRAHNIHMHDGVSEADFVAMRTQRDATLEMPVLILPAVQVNIRAGELPPAEANGTRYLKIPLNAL